MSDYIICSEWEIKYLITQGDYNRCLALGEAKKQINHYFVSDTQPIKSVRVREKNGEYEFTYKSKREDGKGRDEHNARVDLTLLQSFIANGISAQELLRLSGAKLEDMHYIGALTTYRITYPYNGLTIEVDKNTYLGETDYEVECEIKTKAEYDVAEQYLLSEFSCLAGKNKTMRFLSRLNSK